MTRWYVDTDGFSITVRGTVTTEDEARKMLRAIEVNIPLLAKNEIAESDVPASRSTQSDGRG